MKYVILFAGVAVFLLSAGFTGMAVSADKTDHIEVVVETGDTLWQIAQQYYGDSRDIRLIIDDIKAYNDLDDVTIRPGDTLLLPH